MRSGNAIAWNVRRFGPMPAATSGAANPLSRSEVRGCAGARACRAMRRRLALIPLRRVANEIGGARQWDITLRKLCACDVCDAPSAVGLNSLRLPAKRHTTHTRTDRQTCCRLGDNTLGVHLLSGLGVAVGAKLPEFGLRGCLCVCVAFFVRLTLRP